MGYFAKFVLILDGKGHTGRRGIIDTLENCIDQIHSFFLEAEVLGHGGLGELDVEVDGLAGVGWGYGSAEEVVTDVVEEYRAFLS